MIWFFGGVAVVTLTFVVPWVLAEGIENRNWAPMRKVGAYAVELSLGVIVVVGALCLHDAIAAPKIPKLAEKAAVDMPTVERVLVPGTHILLGDHVTVLTFKGRFTAAAQNKINEWWSVIDSLPRNQ